MNTPNEYYAYLTLAGDFDPAEVSYQVGLLPTQTWTPAETGIHLCQRAGFGSPQSRWSLSSRLAPTVALERHVIDVLNQIEPCKHQIRDLRLKISGWLQLVAYVYTGFSGFGLDERLIDSLSQLHLGIDFVCYHLNSSPGEDA